MVITKNVLPNAVVDEQDVYTFKREDGIWYICLPGYLERGWDKRDLQLVEGAHKFLNTLSNGAKKLRLRISTQFQQEADVLEVVEYCNAPRGGAIYMFKPISKPSHGSLFWICDLTLFVFGDVPERIYIRRLPLKNKASYAENKVGATQYSNR